MTPERFRRLRRVLERRQPDLTVLMDQVHKPHNFSAILRSCDAVGVLEAHAVPVDGHLAVYRGTAVGSGRWVRVHQHSDLTEAVDLIRSAGMRLVAAHPSPDALDFRAMDLTGPTCLVVGAELEGISELGLRLADATVTIPMAGMVRSLNVSVATAVILFEAYRQRQGAGMYDAPRLDDGTLTKTLFEWAYPRVARECRAASKPYPALDEDGEILRG